MGGGYYFWLGASADADPATHEPSLATRLGPSGERPLRKELADELTRHAGNLQRYPFESATMNEAARMAADALRKIRKAFLA